MSFKDGILADKPKFVFQHHSLHSKVVFRIPLIMQCIDIAHEKATILSLCKFCSTAVWDASTVETSGGVGVLAAISFPAGRKSLIANTASIDSVRDLGKAPLEQAIFERARWASSRPLHAWGALVFHLRRHDWKGV